MPRANIDLSWLASLLTKSPTATENPAYGAQEQQYEPSHNFLTGKDVDIPSEYFDANGNPVDTKLIDKFGTINKYQSPSGFQRAFYPDQSAQIDKLNNEFVARPALAKLDDSTKLGINTSHIDELPDAYKIPHLTSRQQALVGMGNYNSPTDILQQSTSGLNLEGGLPYSKSLTDRTQQQVDLSQAQGALNREPMTEQVLDEKTANNLAQLTGVDRAQIKLTAMQLAGDMKRFPTAEEVREAVLNNQLNEANNIVPLQQNLDKTNLGVQQELATARQPLVPYLKQTQANQAMWDAYNSGEGPVGAEYVNRLNPNGSISPLVKNPLGANPLAIEMSGLNDIGSIIGGKDQVITDPKTGYSVRAKSNSLSGRPAIGVLSGTSSDAIPVQHSSNPPATINKQEGSANTYPEPNIPALGQITLKNFMKQFNSPHELTPEEEQAAVLRHFKSTGY